MNHFSIIVYALFNLLFSLAMFDYISFYNNAFYAKVGGISTMEMNLLELDFLFGVGFELNVTPTTFYMYFSHIQREIMLGSPPLYLEPSSSSSSATNNLHRCINEDESSPPHQHQLAAV